MELIWKALLLTTEAYLDDFAKVLREFTYAQADTAEVLGLCSGHCVAQHTHFITWSPCLLETSLPLPRAQSDPTTKAVVRVAQHPKPLSRVSQPPFRGLLDDRILRVHQHGGSMG